MFLMLGVLACAAPDEDGALFIGGVDAVGLVLEDAPADGELISAVLSVEAVVLGDVWLEAGCAEVDLVAGGGGVSLRGAAGQWSTVTLVPAGPLRLQRYDCPVLEVGAGELEATVLSEIRVGVEGGEIVAGLWAEALAPGGCTAVPALEVVIGEAEVVELAL